MKVSFRTWRSNASRHSLVFSLASLAAVLTTAFAASASADPAASVSAGLPEIQTRQEALEKYFTVERVRVVELAEEEVAPTLDELNGPALEALGLMGPGLSGGRQDKGSLAEADLALDTIINMGRKIWTIVDANRPVVSSTPVSANALPQGVNGWYSLESWQAPVRRAWRVQYENLYGWTVVDFTYKLVYTPGGRMNGRGRYLTNVSVMPVHLDVAWGYTFNAKGSVPAVTNAGSVSHPVAAAEVLLEWTVDTALKHSRSTHGFYVRGDGHFQSLDH